METLLIVAGLVVLFGPFIYAGFVLTKLDAAAKLRKGSQVGQRWRFMIVDFFSLMLLVQMPFRLLVFELDRQTLVWLVTVCLGAVVAIWFTTIKTVSQAGIVSFRWRALVSMVLIPTMYLGSFYFGIATINWFHGELKSIQAIFWLVISLVGMVASPWIVRGALKSVDQSPVDAGPKKVVDPFAD